MAFPMLYEGNFENKRDNFKKVLQLSPHSCPPLNSLPLTGENTGGEESLGGRRSRSQVCEALGSKPESIESSAGVMSDLVTQKALPSSV